MGIPLICIDENSMVMYVKITLKTAHIISPYGSFDEES